MSFQLSTSPAWSALYRGANLPAGNAFTMCGWFRFNTLAEAYFLTCEDSQPGQGSPSNFKDLGYNGSNLGIWDFNGGSGFTAFGSTPSTGQWFFAATTCNGTTFDGYLAYLGDTSFDHKSATASSYTPTSFAFGNTAYSHVFQGAFMHPRIFDRALSESELLLEMYSSMPFAIADLNSFFREVDSSSAQDMSANARHPTINGTITISDNPPISNLWLPSVLHASLSTGATASLAAIEEADSLAAALAVRVDLDVSLAEQADQIAADLSVGVALAVTAQEAADVLLADVSAPVGVAAQAIESADVLEAALALGTALEMAVRETPDSLAAALAVPVGAAFSLTEDADRLSADVSAPVGVAAQAIESADVLEAALSMGATASLAAVEEADSLAAALAVRVDLDVSLAEQADQIAADLSVGVALAVTAQEGADSFISEASTSSGAIDCAAQEAADRCDASLSALIAASMAAEEGRDIVLFRGPITTQPSKSPGGVIRGRIPRGPRRGAPFRPVPRFVAIRIAEPPDGVRIRLSTIVAVAARLSEARDRVGFRASLKVLATARIQESSDSTRFLVSPRRDAGVRITEPYDGMQLNVAQSWTEDDARIWRLILSGP